RRARNTRSGLVLLHLPAVVHHAAALHAAALHAAALHAAALHAAALHAATLHHGATSGRDAGSWGTDRNNRQFHFDGAGLFELQRRLDRAAGLERMLDVEEHHVIAARLESHCLARLDFQPAFDRPHSHHAVFHAHCMDLTLPGGITPGAGQTI